MQALHYQGSRHCAPSDYWLDFARMAEELYGDLDRVDPGHPLVLQAFVQCSLLVQDETLGEPCEVKFDAM